MLLDDFKLGELEADLTLNELLLGDNIDSVPNDATEEYMLLGNCVGAEGLNDSGAPVNDMLLDDDLTLGALPLLFTLNIPMSLALP